MAAGLLGYPGLKRPEESSQLPEPFISRVHIFNFYRHLLLDYCCLQVSEILYIGVSQIKCYTIKPD